MEVLEDVVDLVEDNVGVTGLAVGVGAAILSPSIFNTVANVVKPVAKAMIKGGIIFYERGKETFAEIKEVGEDLVAEAKEEAKVSLAKKHEVSAAQTAKTEKPAKDVVAKGATT